MKLIDPKLVCLAAEAEFGEDIASNVRWLISHIPRIEARPVVHGAWSCEGDGYYFCNECKKYFVIHGGSGKFNYCLNCGANITIES